MNAAGSVINDHIGNPSPISSVSSASPIAASLHPIASTAFSELSSPPPATTTTTTASIIASIALPMDTSATTVLTENDPLLAPTTGVPNNTSSILNVSSSSTRGRAGGGKNQYDHDDSPSPPASRRMLQPSNPHQPTSSAKSTGTSNGGAISWRKLIYALFAFLFATAGYLLLSNRYLPSASSSQWSLAKAELRCVALVCFVGILWATEACPLFVTGLMIPLLTVMLKILPNADRSGPLPAIEAAPRELAKLADPNVVLLLGGLTIAEGLHQYGLDARIAQVILRPARGRPSMFLLLLMLVAYFVSAVCNNVSAALLCRFLILPVLTTNNNNNANVVTETENTEISLDIQGHTADHSPLDLTPPAAAGRVSSVLVNPTSSNGQPTMEAEGVSLFPQPVADWGAEMRAQEQRRAFHCALVMALAFGCNVGGMTTPVASPQNAAAVSAINAQNETITFATWMLFAIPNRRAQKVRELFISFHLLAGPVLLVSFPLLLLTWAFVLRYWGISNHIPSSRHFALLGADQSSASVSLGFVEYYVLCVCGLTLALWCTAGYTLSLFGGIGPIGLLPVILLYGPGCLPLANLKQLDWGLLLLVGGGASLGDAVKSSGLLEDIATKLGEALDLSGNHWWSFMTLNLAILLIANIISHVVTGITFLPVIARMGASVTPTPKTIPFVLAAAMMDSGACGLPISSFPNLIAYGINGPASPALVQRYQHPGDAETPYLRPRDFMQAGAVVELVCLAIVGTVGWALSHVI